MKKHLEIARFTKTQGLKGEIRAEYYADDPEEIGDFETLYLGKEKTPVSVDYVRPVKNIVIIKLKELTSIEEAQKLIGKTLYIDRDDVMLPEDTWFIQDLIGLSVVDADSGRRYGTVKEILQNAPTDVYVIKAENGKELMFPAIPEVLIDTDIIGGRITIRPLAGLFEDDED